MTLIDEKYLSKISGISGRCAYRGQADKNWKLHAAATRRLIKHSTDQEDITQVSWFSRIYLDYHRNELIEPARTNGFGIEGGYRISDLQLLAKLQHFGAATGLLDFTWSPLVALWFASEEGRGDCDGKIFVINLNNPILQPVSNNVEQQSVEAIFSTEGMPAKTRYWESTIQGEAAPRVLRQRSVFVIGCPLISEDAVEPLEISASDKRQIRKELEDMFDIGKRSLFMDIHGFSGANRVDSPLQHPQLIKDPNFHLVQGNQFYQQGDYSNAISSYDRCINFAPTIGVTYFLRGNAKAENGNYREAIPDYDLAILHNDRHFYNTDINAEAQVNAMPWMIYFNRGNVKAELGDSEGALVDYNQAIQLYQQEFNEGNANLFFNRANTFAMLHRFEEAIRGYDDAIRLGSRSAHFNKANILVILGRFDEALRCYNELMQDETNRVDTNQNRRAVQEILNLIDSAAYEIPSLRNRPWPGLTLLEVRVQVARDNLQEQSFVFCGNIGNAGNFGIYISGGKGFGGKKSFIVSVGSQEDLSNSERNMEM